MKRSPMTIEELKELKPTYEKPVFLLCDDGYFTSGMRAIKVVAIYEEGIVFINTYKDLSAFSASNLTHYPSLKEEDSPKIEILYECMTTYGSTQFLFEDGNYPVFHRCCKGHVSNMKHLTRKTGRTMELNMDTWEVVE